MAEPEKNEHSEEQFDDLSLEELLRGAREEIARVDAMMGNPADEPVQEPDAADALDAAGEGPADVAADGDAPARTEPKAAMPAFEPQLPDEYADLTVDEEQPDEEAPAHEKFRLPAGVRVFAYVCCVLAASVLLAIGAWRCADDMLALTRENFTVNVTVPENATIAQISTELKDKGLIQYEWLFKFYCWFSKAERKIDPGTYELRGAYDYHALVNGMVRTSGDRATATVMIPEGYECEDIFALLAENGVCTVEQLEDAAANHEYDYAFLADLPYGQKNRLEGYLFPDTYEFYVGDDPVNVLDKFLRRFDSKVTEEMYDAVDALNANLAEKMAANGFTDSEIAAAKLDMHDVIIVASLIEKETAKASESPSIAAVIYNRLCSKLYPCLEIDATIQYALDERKEVLSNADKGIISPYNTYKNAGLPAGPISNPGIASIRAALYPAESDDYFYALGNDGVHHFSRTYYEHQDFLESLNVDDTTDTTDAPDETAPDAAQTDETAAGGEAGGSDENTQTP